MKVAGGSVTSTPASSRGEAPQEAGFSCDSYSQVGLQCAGHILQTLWRVLCSDGQASPFFVFKKRFHLWGGFFSALDFFSSLAEVLVPSEASTLLLSPLTLFSPSYISVVLDPFMLGRLFPKVSLVYFGRPPGTISVQTLAYDFFSNMSRIFDVVAPPLFSLVRRFSFHCFHSGHCPWKLAASPCNELPWSWLIFVAAASLSSSSFPSGSSRPAPNKQ